MGRDWETMEYTALNGAPVSSFSPKDQESFHKREQRSIQSREVYGPEEATRKLFSRPDQAAVHMNALQSWLYEQDSNKPKLPPGEGSRTFIEVPPTSRGTVGRVSFPQEGSSEQVSKAVVEDQTPKYIWAEQNGFDWLKNKGHEVGCMGKGAGSGRRRGRRWI